MGHLHIYTHSGEKTMSFSGFDLDTVKEALENSRWDRYLGMTAVMTQVPVGYLIQCHFTFHSNLII